MEKFGALDSSEKMVAILGDICSPQTANEETDKISNIFECNHGRNVLGARSVGALSLLLNRRRNGAPSRGGHIVSPLPSLEVATPENKSTHSKLSSIREESVHKVRKSTSQVALDRIQPNLHAACRLPQGALRVVRAMSTRSVKEYPTCSIQAVYGCEGPWSYLVRTTPTRITMITPPPPSPLSISNPSNALSSTWEKRDDRPNVGGDSSRSRNRDPSRKECVANQRSND